MPQGTANVFLLEDMIIALYTSDSINASIKIMALWDKPVTSLILKDHTFSHSNQQKNTSMTERTNMNKEKTLIPFHFFLHGTQKSNLKYKWQLFKFSVAHILPFEQIMYVVILTECTELAMAKAKCRICSLNSCLFN